MNNEKSFFDNDQLHLLQHVQTGKFIGEIVNQKISPDASSTPSFGETIVCKLKKSGDDQLDDGYIIFDISALSGGTGGTYRRAVNAVALFLALRFELWQENKIKDTADPNSIYHNVKKYSNSDKYASISTMLGIDSQANRTTLGGSAQKFAIPLSLLFALFQKPLDIAMLKGDLEIRIPLRDNVRHVIQTDHNSGTATFSITNTYIDAQYIRPKKAVIEANRQLRKGKGWTYYNVNHTIVSKSIASSSTSANLPLPSVTNKRVIDMNGFLRASALSNTNDASDYTDTYIAPTSWNVKSGGKFLMFGIQEDITKSYYDRVILPRLELPGWKNILSGTASSENDFLISYANDHNVESSESKRYHGSRYFDERDVELNVNFSSLAAQTDLIVIIRTAERFVIDNEGVIHNL